jgi:hypothetical protein
MLGEEERLHLAVAQFLNLALKPPTLWSTIHHGARVSVRERFLVKRKGARAGLPDVLVLHPDLRRRHAAGGARAEKQDRRIVEGAA